MSIDRGALLNAILLHPDEDTPKLMYADWLQENGDEEWAEFIREQVAFPSDTNFDTPSPQLRRLKRKWSVDCECKKGLIWHLSIKLNQIHNKDVVSLFRSHPIREVGLYDLTYWYDVETDGGMSDDSSIYYVGVQYDEGDVCNLPNFMIRHLNGWKVEFACGDVDFLYKGFDSMQQALSIACVRRGRKLAGLPPLTPKEERSVWPVLKKIRKKASDILDAV